jgi:hypothetical protein
MSRHHLSAATAALLVTVVVGCSGDAPSIVAGEEPSLREMSVEAYSPQLPLSGRCETTFEPPPFPPPPVFTQTDTGTCTMAHLGRAAFHSVKEIDLAAGTQTTTEATFTAANGDVLRAVGSGTSAPIGPGQIGFSATLTFMGGTGRFANAAGEAHVEGFAWLATSTASLEIIGGWITYGR